jgi:hypothetical protein
MRNREAFLFAVVIASQPILGACSKSQTVHLTKQATFRPHQPITLGAPEPLLVVGSTNQLCLQIRPPDSLNMGPDNWEFGVRRTDGVIVKVGAALLHADNSADTISSVGYSMGADHCLTIGPSIHDSLHPPFTAVRITTTDSLPVFDIRWESWTGW